MLLSSSGHVKKACFDLGQVFYAGMFLKLHLANDNVARLAGLNIPTEAERNAKRLKELEEDK